VSVDEIDGGIEHAAPIWAVFGDLMSGLLGAFVLILVGVLGVHLELATSLETEVQKRKVEEQRRVALEQALAGPLIDIHAELGFQDDLVANPLERLAHNLFRQKRSIDLGGVDQGDA